jgi:hypothetical protein
MATVVILNRDDYDALSAQLEVDKNVAVVSRQALDEANMTEEQARERAADYDCGGDADTWVEWVSHADHYFIAGCESDSGTDAPAQ